MMIKTLLWLDDVRNPYSADWVLQYAPEYTYNTNVKIEWVKNSIEFKHWIEKYGLPDTIAFDHDLGEEVSGYDCAKWLTVYCMDNHEKLPQWTVQSANPVGKDNINGLLNNFLKYQVNYLKFKLK